MSQTIATKHISALEERLSVKLLHHTTRKITLDRRYPDSVDRVLS
ncbi:LysR family transcriptional regulator, partial [Ensifer sp. P24N7]